MKPKSQIILFVFVLSQLIAAPLFAKSSSTITNLSKTTAKIEHRFQDGHVENLVLQPRESKTYPEGEG